jgi:ATP adenylyltransferase
MIVPFSHVPDLAGCDAATLAEMMQLAQRVEGALVAAYQPEGFNLGMNLGRCAGAGVTGHVHLHLLPRWLGDTNFMTTTAETRVQPEDLEASFEKIHSALAAHP